MEEDEKQAENGKKEEDRGREQEGEREADKTDSDTGMSRAMRSSESGARGGNSVPTLYFSKSTDTCVKKKYSGKGKSTHTAPLLK